MGDAACGHDLLLRAVCVCARACMRVCACVCACVCVYACACVRARARARMCVTVCVCVCARASMCSAKQLVHFANCCFNSCAEQSHKDSVKEATVQEQFSNKTIYPAMRIQFHLPALDLSWALTHRSMFYSLNIQAHNTHQLPTSESSTQNTDKGLVYFQFSVKPFLPVSQPVSVCLLTLPTGP